MTSVIEVVNPKISNFFHNNSHLNAETLLLHVIDFIEKTGNNTLLCDGEKNTGNIYLPLSSSFSSFTSDKNQFQITELKQSLEMCKEAIQIMNKTLLSSFFQYKSEYINEFKSLVCENNIKLLLEANGGFIYKIQSLLFSFFPEYVFKTKYVGTYDKIVQLIKQFHKIINANVETIFSKNDIAFIQTEYISNFEINSGHMVQTIQQHISEIINGKSDLVSKCIHELSQGGGDNTQTQYSKLNYELNDLLQNMKKCEHKNNCAFDVFVSQIFPTSSIQHLQGDDERNNILVVRENNKPTIHISSKAFRDKNINSAEIKDFVKTVQMNNCHGILISQYTGITSKPNYHIDIQGSNITVYLHNTQYLPEKLQIASDMIDSIHNKLNELHMSPDIKQSIPKDVLDDINREYQNFITQRETILTFIKETHKKMLSQISDITFPSLDKFLSSRYSSFKKQGYICDICNSFSVPTLKGLAAHKRGCNRKHKHSLQHKNETNDTFKIHSPPSTPKNYSKNNIQ